MNMISNLVFATRLAPHIFFHLNKLAISVGVMIIRVYSVYGWLGHGDGVVLMPEHFKFIRCNLALNAATAIMFESNIIRISAAVSHGAVFATNNLINATIPFCFFSMPYILGVSNAMAQAITPPIVSYPAKALFNVTHGMEKKSEGLGFTAWAVFALMEGEGKKERQLKLYPGKEWSLFAGVLIGVGLSYRQTLGLSPFKKSGRALKKSCIGDTFMFKSRPRYYFSSCTPGSVLGRSTGFLSVMYSI